MAVCWGGPCRALDGPAFNLLDEYGSAGPSLAGLQSTETEPGPAAREGSGPGGAGDSVA